MFPKTVRVTGESSWSSKTAPAMPDATVTAANSTPIATTIWWGLTRRKITSANLPNECDSDGIPRDGQAAEAQKPRAPESTSAVRLAVELADPAGQHGQDLVGE